MPKKRQTMGETTLSATATASISISALLAFEDHIEWHTGSIEDWIYGPDDYEFDWRTDDKRFLDE